jgi:Raf kinase inhibitor-like YbhB/YbcL family protein
MKKTATAKKGSKGKKSTKRRVTTKAKKTPKAKAAPKAMTISSPAFQHNGNIPAKYTCDGENINPPLAFDGVPSDAESLALIMEDRDVPHTVRENGVWDHWILFNMNPKSPGIREGEEPGGNRGVGSGGHMNYEGPCPCDREHRYFFKLYALDKKLDLPVECSKYEVLHAMEGHLLAYAELVGKYERV